VQYFNKLARFTGDNTIELKAEDGSTETITASKVLIATGGRPTYPSIPGGREHGITSDDLFWLPKSPGKTLIVGASYIALECAGFLWGMGYDVTVMVRSIFLRGFDQQMANKVGEYMETQGVQFIKVAVPTEVKLNSEGKKVVTYKQEGEEK
jgi:thioredoxin reductase (NADPH)